MQMMACISIRPLGCSTSFPAHKCKHVQQMQARYHLTASMLPLDGKHVTTLKGKHVTTLDGKHVTTHFSCPFFLLLSFFFSFFTQFHSPFITSPLLLSFSPSLSFSFFFSLSPILFLALFYDSWCDALLISHGQCQTVLSFLVFLVLSHKSTVSVVSGGCNLVLKGIALCILDNSGVW